MFILSQSSLALLHKPTTIRLKFSSMRQNTQNNGALNAIEVYFSLLIPERFWKVDCVRCLPDLDSTVLTFGFLPYGPLCLLELQQ